MDWSLFLEILGFTVGVIYLALEYFANPLVWLASVIMPCISMWIYLDKGLYADFAINIYYLVIAVYGFIAWTWGGRRRQAQQQTAQLPVSRLRLSLGLLLTAITGVLWLLLAWVLMTFTNSTVPWADGFTTALSIVALWMMARKIAEQWLAWLIVDAVCVGLYAYKGIYFYAVLYAIYTVIAWFGYQKWLKFIPSQKSASAD